MIAIVDNDNIIITLTKEEAQRLYSCIIRTNAKGDDLTVGMKLEDELIKCLKPKK